jgi:hypothetical protein
MPQRDIPILGLGGQIHDVYGDT